MTNDDPTNVPPGGDALVLLVVRAQLGEPEALHELVEHWHGPVFRYVSALVGDSAEAADVNQNAWAGALRALPRLRERERFAAWLFSIARRAAMDRLRRRYRALPALPWNDDLEVAHEVDEAPVDVDDLRLAIGDLAPLEREVIALHYLEGLPLADIASIAGVPIGTIKSRLFRARAQLRERLTQDHPGNSNEE